MSNWKEEARNYLKDANVPKALQVMANNGIIVDRFLNLFKKYSQKQTQVRSENRTYTDLELQEQQELFQSIIKQCLNAINTK